jgi:hypothetical protein
LSTRLHPIPSVSCGPTAVCAVTGASSAVALDTMMRAVDFDSARPHHLNDSAFRHQIRAANMLGFDIFNVDGTPYDATVPGGPMNPGFDLHALKAASSIADFVSGNDLDDVVICYAHSGIGEGHTFAADGRTFFDNNTGGKVVDASGIHPQVRNMKVIQVFRARPRPAEAEVVNG